MSITNTRMSRLNLGNNGLGRRSLLLNDIQNKSDIIDINEHDVIKEEDEMKENEELKD